MRALYTVDLSTRGAEFKYFAMDLAHLACIPIAMVFLTFMKTGTFPAHVPDVYMNTLVGITLYWLVGRKVVAFE